MYIRPLSSLSAAPRSSRCRPRLPRIGSVWLPSIAPLLPVPAKVSAVFGLREPRLQAVIPAAEVLPVSGLPEPLLVCLALPRLRARRQAARLLVPDVWLGKEEFTAIVTTTATAAAHRRLPAGASTTRPARRLPRTPRRGWTIDGGAWCVGAAPRATQVTNYK